MGSCLEPTSIGTAASPCSLPNALKQIKKGERKQESLPAKRPRALRHKKRWCPETISNCTAA
eukprot:321466-Pelagomonas_calceolata.AAC.1